MADPLPFDSAAHQRLTARRQAGYQQKQARATRDKGLLIIYTGNGKGKSTAAFGMGLRIIGHGLKLGVVQFIKGAQFSAEREVLSRLPNVDFHTTGDGFTWHTQDRERDLASAARAWNVATRMLADPSYQMVILDELNLILRYGYLDLAVVLATLAGRREGLHVVVTGRHAPSELIALADLVSDVRAIKHPYKEQGVRAQRGVEY